MKTYTELELAQLKQEFLSRGELKKGAYSAYKFALKNNLLDSLYGPSRSKPKPLKKWLEEARGAHKEDYSYQLVKWAGYNTKNAKKVEVICHRCKDSFFISPVTHIAKPQGCPTCGRKKQAEAQKDTTSSFIAKALKKHKGRYDYTRIKYVDSQTPVEINCLNHGSFYQRPNSHLRGSGCPNCADELTGERCRLGTEEFIKKSHITHGQDKYDYSRVQYINAHTKVEILCDFHGPFWQC